MRKYLPEAFVAAFALLVSTTAATAYAQTMPDFAEVSGTYTNEEAGVSITFPDGWTGASIGTDESVLVTVSPGGMAEEGKAMMLVIADKSQVDEAPTDPSDVSQEESGIECTTPSFQPTTVSGVRGVEAVIECTDEDGEMTKMKIVSAESETRWISAMYSSASAEFDADVGAFDTAVDSLTLTGAVDSTIPSGTPDDGGTTPSMMPVMVAGESVNVSVESASTISAFALDEASKTLSFETDGTGAETTVMVGSVLEGPYTVLVDGQATRAEESQVDGVNTLVIPHSSGAHDVTVTGTQVVPEFPVAIIGIVAAMIGTIVVLGRTKLMKGSL